MERASVHVDRRHGCIGISRRHNSNTQSDMEVGTTFVTLAIQSLVLTVDGPSLQARYSPGSDACMHLNFCPVMEATGLHKCTARGRSTTGVALAMTIV